MINSYDFDGVIYLGDDLRGVTPRISDVIITGRTLEERSIVLGKLRTAGITNMVFFNPEAKATRTRKSCGVHKGRVLRMLVERGIDIGVHFEDDPVQADEIVKFDHGVQVVLLQHELTEK